MSVYDTNPLLWRKTPLLWSYGAAILSVAAATLISHAPTLHLGSAPVSLLLCAVMFSAWFGGVGPGVLAVCLSALVFYFSFLPPIYSLALKAEQIPRFLVFIVSALFVGALSAAQQGATESLRRARDKLSETVQELKKANEALGESEAYLLEAQRLTRTGSWAWSPVSGDIRYWSEECYRVLGFDPAGPPPPFETFFQRIHPDDQAGSRERFEKAIRDKADFEMDYRIVQPDGDTRNIHVVGHPALGPSGNLIEFIGTVIDVSERLRAEDDLRRAFDDIKELRDQLYRENLALREEIDVTRMFEEIVGSSPALQSALSRVSKVAPTDSTVLITGETGTGKELIARAIHKRSQRSSRAFVSVNCAAIPRDLIGSELFGHEKGAFTGALQRRLGRFESAEGGTIFLDEVGELPLETQIALLRVLQEREYQRVGGNEPLHADVRVVAATNRDLQAAIAEGRFREDLFYRLNVFPIEVPPLRERKEDIPLLVEYFVDRYASKAGKTITGINKKSMELLQSYSWPGNIRELQNVMERSVIICDSENLSVDESWLMRRTPAADSSSQPLSERLATQEKAMIEAALAEAKGRVSGPQGAAARLGIPQSTLDSKIKSLKINKYRFRRA
jgi:DNA-binding NtrC family response regulator/PAS domain-containing protein